jgi:leucyl aminopeptidase (aminopeptidase T)
MLISMMQGARRLVRDVADVKTGESVLIVTDTNKMEIAEAIAAAAYERKTEVTIAVMTPRKAHRAPAPKVIASAIKAADVIFAPTTVSMSVQIHELMGSKARAISLAGWYPEQLVSGGLYADFQGIKPVVDKLAQCMAKAKKAHVTTEAGTDIVIGLNGARALYGGIAREPGSYCSCPIIEAYGNVELGTSEGTLVVDGSLCLDELSPLKEPVTVEIRNGRIEKIEGGWYARKFRSFLGDLNDPYVYTHVEFAFGLNPEAKCRGYFAEDEATGGSNHFGFGGGQLPSTTGVHTDLVVLNTTTEIDGKIVLKEGELRI